MTGDIVPRNIDSSTKPANIQVIQKVSQLIYKYYPTITVIPALGNHEAHPVNFFSPPENIPEEINTRWIYNVTWNSWFQWIPPSQKRNFFTGGYYALEKSKEFKILVLNTNLCYGLNL
jgi:sphingomyelin phosphodiesterase